MLGNLYANFFCIMLGGKRDFIIDYSSRFGLRVQSEHKIYENHELYRLMCITKIKQAIAIYNT